jgi:ATP-dependent RNA helicase DDX31/DBP7
MFHIRHLHLGHLAKAFALRESPKNISGAVLGTQNRANKTGNSRAKSKAKHKAIDSHQEVEDEEADRSENAERRMQTVVRAQGRLTKKDGVMMSSGVSEFQIAGGDDLEKLVHKHRS